MISDARGGHVSPGIYTEEKDVQYAAKSLGITKLGLVGETLKGPAFQPLTINSWSDFTDYFGGTAADKYKGNGYPKYELPYIAKSYLNESKQLEVCRVLGLSGYLTSSAYGVSIRIYGQDSTRSVIKKEIPLVILRSKGDFNGSISSAETPCEKNEKVESFRQYVTNIELLPYSGTSYGANCTVVPTANVYPIDGIITATTTGLKYISSDDGKKNLDGGKFAIKVSYNDYTETDDSKKNKTAIYNVSLNPGANDYIYKVLGISPLDGDAPIFIESVYDFAWNRMISEEAVGTYFSFASFSNDSLIDFREPFRAAETPWVVSDIKGATADRINLKKMFKFYTISDGNAANYQVKVSIENIRPDEGLFNVVVRDFYDTDSSIVVLEKFTNLSMIEGESNFIGLRIGTYDGEFENKSKYITVRFVEDRNGIADCVPCGFLGYPMPMYGCSNKIEMQYSTLYNDDIKAKRQYFGLTDTILDEDVLNYKGVKAYSSDNGDASPVKICNGFHMDSILDITMPSAITKSDFSNVYVDGELGYTFTAVKGEQGVYKSIPRILNEDYMEGTLYADKNLRKFTMYTYGGFDGWDIYRENRTNSDSFKASKYQIWEKTDASGNTIPPYCPFKRASSELGEQYAQLNLHLPAKAITSDYYAYLAGYYQFMNPQDVAINILATPGINWYDNAFLTEDVIDMVESVEDGRGGDALYVMDSPQYDKDGNDYSADEIVDFLDGSDINSSYVCTYFPWAKYYDADAKKYINLPVTRDVVRNMAKVDNEKYPWYAPAGDYNGVVDCIKPYFKTDLATEDTLYAAGVNPVKHFAADKKVELWGQKTLYKVDSPLNRINVRRLMIRIKQLVINASKSLIFDQYDASLEKQFRSIVEPILNDVKSNRGISDYRLVTECTPETRDQLILPAKILIKPIHSLEYISISFTVYPESVEFNENA